MRLLLSSIFYGVKHVFIGEAAPGVAAKRAAICRECGECQWRRHGRRTIVGWCGRPLSKRINTCGCPVVRVPRASVGLTLGETTVERRYCVARRVAVAFRKTRLKGERCPQNKW